MRKRIEILSPEQNIVNTLRGKTVLFLENSADLSHQPLEFQKILKKNKIKHKVLGNIRELPLEKVLSYINKYDCIAFQTQWVYEVSNKLAEYMFSLKEKKIVVECYISEPTWYYKPKAVHDVYLYTCVVSHFSEEKEGEKFMKLSDKPYWDYKNKFDK